jgi:hypothetical protein
MIVHKISLKWLSHWYLLLVDGLSERMMIAVTKEARTTIDFYCGEVAGGDALEREPEFRITNEWRSIMAFKFDQEYCLARD